MNEDNKIENWIDEGYDRMRDARDEAAYEEWESNNREFLEEQGK